MKQLCFAYPESCELQLRLYQTGFDEFTLQYGTAQRNTFDERLTYRQAARQIGIVMMKMAAGAGRLDNRLPKDAKADGDSEPYFSKPVEG